MMRYRIGRIRLGAQGKTNSEDEEEIPGANGSFGSLVEGFSLGCHEEGWSELACRYTRYRRGLW